MDGTGGTFGRQGYSLVLAVTSFHPFSSLSVVLRRRMSGPCGFEIPGGAGETAQGAVGDELAAGPHVPLLGFALAGDERGAGRAACLHDLEDEDAVRRVDRRGQEIVQDRQVDALEFVDLPVVGGLAVEPGAVDFLEHVLHARVSCGNSPAACGVAEGLADVAFPLPVPGDDDQGLPVTHPLAGDEAFDPVAAELAFGWVFDVLDARVLVFEPRLLNICLF